MQHDQTQMLASSTNASAKQSWAWLLRAEKAKEPQLNGVMPRGSAPSEAPRARKKPAPGLTAPAAFAKAKGVLKLCGPEVLAQKHVFAKARARKERSENAFSEAQDYAVQVVFTDDSEAEFDKEIKQSYERRLHSLGEPQKSMPEDFGFALNFFRAYESSLRGLKAPVWRELEETGAPPPLPPRVRRSGQRSWAEEAAVQRKLALERQAKGDPQAVAALQMEIRQHSKERLLAQIRTGQMQRAKQELFVSALSLRWGF
eukprot:s300_g15.t1